MPLVRFQLRNEFRLGQPELYKQADKEDPKALLDDVAVAGLVGILRQLGDLAEFGAEVFHGLQEQVMTTASRSHKLMIRVQQIEAALPPLEKAVYSQTSHIHFAYTAGSEWHPRIQNAKNHFIYNDLPQFIMDSYEDCRAPPRFDLLDKFDMGGPGSCLKRYSDPTFFKRISGSSIEANSDKVQTSKKAHKSKCQNGQKRSSLRNGEPSRAPSIYTHIGRMQFTSPIVNEHTSPSPTASTVDMDMKYDMQEHSNFFDLRTGSGRIDCVFDVSSSMQPEKQEAKEASSRLVLNCAGNPAKDFLVQQPQVVDDNFSVSSSQEQIARSSSFVTWDEKAEIVESRGRHFDRNEFHEVNFDLDMQDRELANLKHVDQMDILLNGADSPESISSRNHVDEIESETDNYVDALNTIESEFEVDTECQIKQEVDPYSRDVNTENREDDIKVLKANNAEHQSSKNESDAASNILTNDGVSRNLPDAVPSECLAGKQIPPFSCKSFDSDHSTGTDLFVNAEILQCSKAESVTGDPSSGSRVNNLQGSPCDTMINTVQEFPKPQPEISSGPSIKIQANGEIVQGSKVESVAVDPSSAGSRVTYSQVPPYDIMVDSVCESPKPHPKISSVPSVKIWTNGGLLGLEPSKPPDFAVTHAAGLNSTSRSGHTVDSVNNLLTTKSDGLKVKQGTFVKDAESIGKSLGLSTSNVSVPLADLHAKVEKCDNSHGSNSHNFAYDSSPSVNTQIPDGSKMLVNPNVNSKTVESDQGKDDTAMFPLGHRLPVNGFCRNVSLNNDIKSEPANPLKSCVLEQKSVGHSMSYQKNLKKQFRSSSPAHSLTSSPPLGLMKISFNPIDGFETFRLKLKFPDGIHSHESNRDMFPSFQLVPEPVIPPHVITSDSDNDTFCRSSYYLSDDCLSNYSESNSEQWESGKTPEQSDQELHDALSRMSSMESVSSSLHVGNAANNGIYMNRGLKPTASESGVEPSLSVPSLDLPSFDAINQVIPDETNSNTTPNNVSELPNSRGSEPTPLPPPLPPAQWRVSTPGLDIAEGRPKILSESFRQELDLKLLGSAVSHKPNPASANQQKINEEVAAVKLENKQLDQQKLNKQRSANQAVNGKVMDEKEDFLQQIRTKSFNLRPTVTAKPTVTSGPTANVKVTAILEKANAIRQAVGSDDDEDDDIWSDS